MFGRDVSRGRAASVITRSVEGLSAMMRSGKVEAMPTETSSHPVDEPWNLNAGIAKEMIALHAKMDRLLAQVSTFMEAMADAGREKGGGQEANGLPPSRARSKRRPPTSSNEAVLPPTGPPGTMPLLQQNQVLLSEINEQLSRSEKCSVTYEQDMEPDTPQLQLQAAASEGGAAGQVVVSQTLSNVSPRASILRSKSRHSHSSLTAGSDRKVFDGNNSTPIVPMLRRSDSRNSNWSKATRHSGGASSFVRSHRSSKSSFLGAGPTKPAAPRNPGRRHAVIVSSDMQELAAQSSSVSMSAAVAAHVQSITRQRRRSNVELKVWKFLEDPARNPGAYCFSWCMDIITICAVLTALFDDLLWRESGWQHATSAVLQLLFDIVFICEIALRFVVCPDRCRFFREVYNLIDLVAGFVPITLWALATATGKQLFDDSLMCVVPFLRMLKLLRRFEQFHLLTQAFAMALEALPFLLYTLILILFAFSSWVFLVEPRDNIPDFGHALWLSLLTASTVGYGDTVPSTPAGRIGISVLVVLAGIYTSIPFGIVGGAFNQVWTDRDRLLLMHRTRQRLLEVGIAPDELPALFRLFDENGDGELSIDEFADLLRQLRVNMSRHRVVELFRVFDADESGTIDGDEFVRVLFPTAVVNQRDKGWSDDVATAAAAGVVMRSQRASAVRLEEEDEEQVSEAAPEYSSEGMPPHSQQ